MFVALLLLIATVQDAPSITPTQPEPARDSSDFLWQTVVTDMMGEEHQELEGRPVLIARTDENITPRILPHAWKFALLDPPEIDTEGMRGRYYMTLRTEWRSADEADVTIYVGPAGPGIKMRCFTVVKRYQRVDGNWQFVRRISNGEHY